MAFYDSALTPAQRSRALPGRHGGGEAYCETPGCVKADDCPVSGEDCREFDCVAGSCELVDLPAQTACTSDGVSCTLDECDGQGICEHLNDCPVPGEACNRDVVEPARGPTALWTWSPTGSSTAVARAFADFADGHDGVCGDAGLSERSEPTDEDASVVAGAQASATGPTRESTFPRTPTSTSGPTPASASSTG